jgi:hypothetical protein|tara:strand:- start:46 stop:558 length:513 start_codon:yes stop_codon:yes gene_type:complete
MKYLYDTKTVNDLFDYRDGNLYWKEKLGNHVDISKPAGSIDQYGYRVIKINGKPYKAHRLIYWMHNPKWDITNNSHHNTVDHKDENKSNNNIKNLRVSGRSAQMCNRSKQKSNTSGEKNVYWCEPSSKWQVRVVKDSKMHFGGQFVNKEDAAAKATEMREELHGEFANHG